METTFETMEDAEKFKEESQKKIDKRSKDIENVHKYKMPESIKKLLDEGKLWDKIVIDELDKKHIGDIKAKEIIFMCFIGRLVEDKKAFSFNDLILSTSSAGKDHLVNSILKMFPRDDYETWGRTSAKTFNYLHNLEEEPDFNYDGKIVYLKEISEGILNNEVMKEFTSSEEDINQIAIPRQKTKTQGAGIDILQIKGHPIVICTTATSTPSDEIRNRFNILGCDESEEQTKRARINISQNYSPEIVEFVKNLKKYKVEIPDELFKFIDTHFPYSKVRHRRDFPKFIDFVKAVTIFNQANRKIEGIDILRATPEDYNLARDIYTNAYSKLSDIPLKDIPNRIVSVMQKEDKPLSAREICDSLLGYVALQNLYPYLADLKYKEIVDEIMSKDAFRPTSKFILSEEYKDKKPFNLPIFEEN